MFKRIYLFYSTYMAAMYFSQTLIVFWLSKNGFSFFEKIAGCVSISLVIRRGDFANDPMTNAYHGTCSLKYYTVECRDIFLYAAGISLKSSPMTSDEFLAWRKRMGWKRVEAADRLGISYSNISFYERGS